MASRQIAFLIAALTKMRCTSRLFGGRLDQRHVLRRPDAADRRRARRARTMIGRRHFLALGARQEALRHRASARCRRRGRPGGEAWPVIIGPPRGCDMSPTSRPGQCRLGAHLAREPLEKVDQRGMAPVAVARQAHHLPGVAGDRQGLAAGEAALGIEADRAPAQRGGLSGRGRTAPWRALPGRRDGRAAARAADAMSRDPGRGPFRPRPPSSAARKGGWFCAIEASFGSPNDRTVALGAADGASRAVPTGAGQITGG